jgi:hypothetical protein
MSELVYLACPYSHEDPRVRWIRFTTVSQIAARLMAKDLFIFSPISHGHPITVHGLPSVWDYWGKYMEEFLRISRAMVVLCLDGWTSSVGVQAEIKIMRELGKPIHFLELDRSIEDLCETLKAT